MGAPFPSLRLRLRSRGGDQAVSVVLDQLVIASWTGRDRAAIEARLVELEGLGITRPPALPMLYPIAASRVTTGRALQVFGHRTSGEVEFVLLQLGGRVWVGVGSDHTDRAMEAQDAGLAKQLCDKPIAPDFWDLADVQAHWDRLRLRSFVTTADGGRELYQDGSVAAMRPPGELLALLPSHGAAAGACLLFCGTLGTHGGIRPSAGFHFELHDPVLGRTIGSGYEVQTLPPHLMPRSAAVV